METASEGFAAYAPGDTLEMSYVELDWDLSPSPEMMAVFCSLQIVYYRDGSYWDVTTCVCFVSHTAKKHLYNHMTHTHTHSMNCGTKK